MFELFSPFRPTGDQPKAIESITQNIKNNVKCQTLLGVTGSGKTFTVANVINNVNKPTLVISHNKTLAAQLYQEFKDFFPNNKVEYFVSYYDYYQPESYLPVSDTYIAKDLSINAEIEKLRLSTSAALASERRDVIVVSSVSCIYGIGNPINFKKSVITLKKGSVISLRQLLFNLVDILYQRMNKVFQRGTFRVKGDTVDIFPSYADFAYRVVLFGNTIEKIQCIDPIHSKKISNIDYITLFPANLFVTAKENIGEIICEIQKDLKAQIDFFNSKDEEGLAKRLQERTELDIEMLKELGFCPGVENYSRYFDGRNPSQRPFCLIDYFPKDFLIIIDESHVTIPQIKAMHGGDKVRKLNLVQHGFRLPSALDNRPLQLGEFESLINQVIYISATPAIYELEQSNGLITEQIIRPTGLLDPKIEVKPSLNQIDDIIDQIIITTKKNERVLITTLTKRMAEELSKYLKKSSIRCTYIHSEIKTLDRIDIINDLRNGTIDVLIGVNLLREGLDLPEVSLVIILDADKEGFLRNIKSLIQTIGRAARNQEGRVIMFADKITNSMQEAIDETRRRRMIQMDYNFKHNITPTTIKKPIPKAKENSYYSEYAHTFKKAADPGVKYMSKDDIKTIIKNLKLEMGKEVKNENFLKAAKLRDEIIRYKKML